MVLRLIQHNQPEHEHPPGDYAAQFSSAGYRTLPKILGSRESESVNFGQSKADQQEQRMADGTAC